MSFPGSPPILSPWSCS
uniref:Uncharacterized protein n=1 Tax=Arundo donax TaxID=35708 RepID=A0A0A8Z7T9_ARUDO